MIRQSAKLFMKAVSHNKLAILKNLSLSIGLELVGIGLLYLLNQTYGSLYQAIQVYDTHGIWLNIGTFTGLAMILVLTGGYTSYFINRLAFNIREGLTSYYFSRKPSKPMASSVPNFQQRIQEDLKRFGESACDFWFKVLVAMIQIPVFIGVIISLTAWYIGVGILLAVILGTVITKLAANRLVFAQALQENNEANFRQNLTLAYFAPIQVQFYVLNNLFKRLYFVQSGLGQIFVLLPFIVLMPLYISKTIAMGAFFQAVNALKHVIDSLSVVIDNRQLIVNIETCLYRLNFLTEE